MNKIEKENNNELEAIQDVRELSASGARLGSAVLLGLELAPACKEPSALMGSSLVT